MSSVPEWFNAMVRVPSVLVVEDEARPLREYRDAFDYFDICPVIASDADAVKAALQEKPFDLLLIGTHLLQTGKGEAICQELKHCTNSGPLIFVSESAEDPVMPAIATMFPDRPIMFIPRPRKVSPDFVEQLLRNFKLRFRRYNTAKKSPDECGIEGCISASPAAYVSP